MCVALCTKSDVKFVDRLDERLACPICKNVFIEPWQTSCGHRFCRNCLDPLLRYVNMVCRSELVMAGENFHLKKPTLLVAVIL